MPTCLRAIISTICRILIITSILQAWSSAYAGPLLHGKKITVITGAGTYVNSLDSKKPVSVGITFKAWVSSHLYRIEAEYQNSHDILVFDGTNTIHLGSIFDSHRKLLGADATIVSGSFPIKAPGYLQVAWMASYLNAELAAGQINNVKDIKQSEMFVANFGEQLANQLIIEQQNLSGKRYFALYLPGDAIRDGKKVFFSPAYKHGMKFEQLNYREQAVTNMVYQWCEFNEYLPSLNPSSSNDVELVGDYSFHILHIALTTNILTTLPPINGSIGIRDYSTSSATNVDKPVLFRITNWKDLRPAQNKYHQIRNETPNTNADFVKRRHWIIFALLLCSVVGIASIFWISAKNPN